MKPVVTVERVRELFTYDPATGEMYWRKRANNNQPTLRAGALSNGYRQVQIDGRLYKAHRLAWLYVYGEWPKQVLDHIDGEHDNNRIANLRDVSESVNMQNVRKARANNKTGLLGVIRVSGGKFRAQLKSAEGTRNLGHFDTPEAAHQMYLETKRLRHEGCTI